MNIFDILGPVMVGPSSSHTAGAVRIGLITAKLLGSKPRRAKIYLHGSFASTGVGHGTDRALIAGLLGMQPDDISIPRSFELAEKKNLHFDIETVNLKNAHPNTALLVVTGEDGQTLEVQASSLGGGRIIVNKIDGIEVNFTGESHTLIVHNMDQPGHVAAVTNTLANNNINIATMQLFRDRCGGYAVMVIETDQSINKEIIAEMKHAEGIIKVTYLDVSGA